MIQWRCNLGTPSYAVVCRRGLPPLVEAAHTHLLELVRDSRWGVVPGRWHDPSVAIMVARAVLAHQLFTGISRRHLTGLVDELAAPWRAGVEGRRHAARGGARKRAAGAGARHRPVFVDHGWWPA